MDTFREKLDEIKKIIDEDVYRKRVLLLCQQAEPKSFDEYSSSGSFRKLEKFESSTYSEVLRAIDRADNNKQVVMKIMRALSKGVIRKLPSAATRNCQSYNDIINELIITQALSQLHDGVLLNGQPNALYRTHFFCLIHEIKVVSGNLDHALSRSRAESRNMDLPATITTAETKVDLNGHYKALATEDGLSFALLAPPPVDVIAPRETAKPTDQQDAENGTKQPTQDSGVVPKEKQSLNGSVIESREDQQQQQAADQNAKQPKDDELKNLNEDERMLMEALPHEYVVSVMRHDGQPLWYMMTHKKLTSEQLASVLVQVIVGLAIAENVYLYEHRDLHVSNILIKKTQNEMIPFILNGQRYNIVSYGVKATIIDATFSRLTHNGKVYCRDLTSTLRSYGSKKTPVRMSLQNRSYRQMVRLTKNNWSEFTPKTNLIWLTYLCETLMKNEIMKGNEKLLVEIRKIRDYTLKVNTTIDLLGYFPFSKQDENSGKIVDARESSSK